MCPNCFFAALLCLGQLRNDKSVVLHSVSRFGDALQYASESLKADRVLVVAAVASFGRALQFAGSDLQASKDVALAAVMHQGFALAFAAESLRNDREARVPLPQGPSLVATLQRLLRVPAY